jgi:hypothetical protein
MSSGVSPRVSASADQSLARVGAANLRRIAVRDGRSYYVANLTGGGLCVTITFPGERDPFVGYSCSPDFPSAKRPLLDVSRFAGSVGAPVIRLFEGFAADAVTTVELVTDSGTRVIVPVKDNVYVRTTDLPDEPVQIILARDSAGSVISRLCLARGVCP